MRTASILTVVLVGMVLGFVVRDENLPAAQKGKQVDRQPTQNELAKAAHDAYDAYMKAFLSGNVTDPENLYRWSRRIMVIERAISPTAERSVAAQGHLMRMQELDQMLQTQVKAGYNREWAAAATGFYQLEALTLLQERAGDELK